MVYKTIQWSNLAGQWITWRTTEALITVYVNSFTAISDCNSFYRTDLAVQIALTHLSLKIDVKTGASSCDKSLRISTSSELSC